MRVPGGPHNGAARAISSRRRYAGLDDLSKQAKLAEKLGYWGVAVPSHFSAAPFQYFHQTSMLAYLAAQVRDMKLISGVNLLPLHKPMDIAEQYAAIDVMSGGNFIFGTGIGYREAKPRSPMAERGRRFEKLGGGPNSGRRDMVGSHFELDGALAPSTAQKPSPPFWIVRNKRVLLSNVPRECRMRGLSTLITESIRF